MIPSHMLSPALFVSLSPRTPITDMAEHHVLCVLLAGQHVSMNLLHHSPLVSCLSQRPACLEPPQTSAPVNFRRTTYSEMALRRRWLRREWRDCRQCVAERIRRRRRAAKLRRCRLTSAGSRGCPRSSAHCKRHIQDSSASIFRP